MDIKQAPPSYDLPGIYNQTMQLQLLISPGILFKLRQAWYAMWKCLVFQFLLLCSNGSGTWDRIFYMLAWLYSTYHNLHQVGSHAIGIHSSDKTEFYMSGQINK